MELHLNIAGVLLIILALIHIGFPRYFHWKQELKALSAVNKQMMYVHTLFIAITVLLMGCLCLTSAQDLTGTVFGRKISLFLGLFWVARLFIQLFGYSPALWKGKSFETFIHILFVVLWSYLSAVFIFTCRGW